NRAPILIGPSAHCSSLTIRIVRSIHLLRGRRAPGLRRILGRPLLRLSAPGALHEVVRSVQPAQGTASDDLKRRDDGSLREEVLLVLSRLALSRKEIEAAHAALTRILDAESEVHVTRRYFR